MKESDILTLIKNDPWMMNILRAAQTLQLPDWMIGAGFVRNKVWDHLHGFENKEVPTADIDLIYFDPNDTSWDPEIRFEKQLAQVVSVNWSIKNQARMHLHHDRIEPYKSSEDAILEWVDTPTCIAVRLENDGQLTLFAPHGIEDLTQLIVRPAPTFYDKLDVFWKRVKSKKWEEKWPKLKIVVEK